MRGLFAEGTEWLTRSWGSTLRLCRLRCRGPALVGHAQLTLASDPASAESHALGGLEVMPGGRRRVLDRDRLNLLTEAALHAGQAGEATAWAEQALATARMAADRWNEGYALGTMAAAAGQRGDLARPGGSGRRHWRSCARSTSSGGWPGPCGPGRPGPADW